MLSKLGLPDLRVVGPEHEPLRSLVTAAATNARRRMCRPDGEISQSNGTRHTTRMAKISSTCCCQDGDERFERSHPSTIGGADFLRDETTSCRAFTVGHSTRSIEEFISLLIGHEITQLVDVRTVPKSRHNPQFETHALEKSLRSCGIGYALAPGLGGFRRTSAESPNSAWRNLSFRGYADYMLTPDFNESLVAAMELMKSDRVALMCAEAVPWRCHRSLIADAMVVHGHEVCEISSPTRLQLHRLTSFARVEGETITYPPEGET